MEHSWKRYLDPYRGKLFEGEWPTLSQIFQMTLDKFPDRICFTKFTPNRFSLTYKEVYEYLINISSYLRENGLEKGDKVAINGKNSIEWAIAYMSINFAGGVVVPLDNQLTNKKVKDLSQYSDCKFFLADKNILESLDKTFPEYLKSFKLCLTLQGKSEQYQSMLSVKPKTVLEIVKGNEDDVAAILFTSGTTGNEKGAVLTQKNIVSDLYQAKDDQFLQLDENDILYALLPLHHSYCCTAVLLVSIAFGCECVFGHGIIVSRMVNDLTRGKVTVFMGIPLLYNKLLAGMMKGVKKKGFMTNALIHFLMFVNGFCKKYFNKNPLRNFFNKKLLSKVGFAHNRILICGAGPLSPKVFKQYQQLGLDFIQGYGLTETSPILALNPTSKFKIESVGKIFPLVDAKIDNPDSSGVGEILVKGPNICQGYYKDEENTKKLFNEEGWLKTGDLGYLDSDNYLYLKGRAKNIIVTEGGKNVYPEEIEDLFQLHTQVDQVLVRGYQEKKDVPAECIEAVIYPDQEYFEKKVEKIEEEINEVVNLVNKELSGYKKIGKITIVDKPMIMTSTKKIKRNLIDK
ncbi:MAG: AMP-binding protein [Pleomorphochaeta sp.]